MNKLMIQGGVLVLMLLALPLTSVGTTTSLDWTNYLGLGTITVAGLTMPVLRFVGDDEDDQDNEEKEDKGQEEADRPAHEQTEEDDR